MLSLPSRVRVKPSGSVSVQVGGVGEGMLKLVQGWLHMEHHAARAKFKKVHFETKNRKSEGSCAITESIKLNANVWPGGKATWKMAAPLRNSQLSLKLGLQRRKLTQHDFHSPFLFDLRALPFLFFFSPLAPWVLDFSGRSPRSRSTWWGYAKHIPEGGCDKI